MNIEMRLAWRNLWRHPRRTWLTTGAMIFCNVLLVFLISMQLSSYRMMIDNTLKAFSGHLQVQAPGYKDQQKIRQTVPEIAKLAATIRTGLGLDTVAARGAAFALVSSEQRSFGVQLVGVQPQFEPRVSNISGLLTKGRFLDDPQAGEIIIGAVLARNLAVDTGDELTVLGSGRDGSRPCENSELGVISWMKSACGATMNPVRAATCRATLSMVVRDLLKKASMAADEALER